MKNITINSKISIKQAMKVLDKTAEKCLLVLDKNNKLLGTLTDGDLRRSILKGVKFTKSIAECFNPKPITLQKGNYSNEVAKTILRTKKLDLIPVIDKDGILIDYITWSKIGEELKNNSSLKEVPVIVMAGGMGTRMDPFTKVLPKPLVPIQEKPIIEHIIESFTNVGCSDFHLTVNYKGRILKAYFEELQPNYNVSFIDEDEPLGTAGSLQYLDDKFDKPFFVSNCDIIIKTNYESIYNFHLQGNYDVTLVASTKEYIIPYGTCELNREGHLSHINEKPKYEFLINTGLYVINPNVLKLIPEGKFYHITHLIEDAKNQGKKVGVFPIDDEAWIDLGQWSEYKKSIELF